MKKERYETYQIYGTLPEAYRAIERMKEKGWKDIKYEVGDHPSLGGWLKVTYEKFYDEEA